MSKRGRPPLPESERRKSIELTLAPDIVRALARVENRSAYVEDLIRRDLRRKSRP